MSMNLTEGLSSAEAMLEGELLSFSPKGKAGEMALAEGLRAKEAVSKAGSALKTILGKRVDMAMLLGTLGALNRGEYASHAEALADYNMVATTRALCLGPDWGPLSLDEGEFEALLAIAGEGKEKEDGNQDA